MGAPLLTIENLSLSYETDHKHSKALLENVSFQVQPGQAVALVGESGSGKSITAKSILRLLNEDQVSYPTGRILFQDQDLLKLPRKAMRAVRGREIAMIFQEPMTALNPLHTIGKQINEALWLHQPLNAKQRAQRVTELLAKVGLTEARQARAYPHQLSGGQRQRAMIAMALANNIKLLIADEPTTALDVTLQAQVLDLLKSLQKTENMALLLITHDLALVRRMVDHVVVMQAGQVVEQNATEALFTDPQHAYTKTLLNTQMPSNKLAVAQDPKPLYQAKALTVAFPKQKNWYGKVTDWHRVLDTVDITIPEQQTLGVVGESGSGKSTLAKALLNLIPAQGQLLWQGEAIEAWPEKRWRPLRKDMQIVFQDPHASLSPRMTVADTVAEGLDVHFPKLSPQERLDKITAALKEVSLEPEVMHRYPHAFSGGQRQRIAIARVLIMQPKLIILDEPTSALDRAVQTTIVELLQDLQARHGLSYVFISHDLRVVEAISHHMVVMHQGKIVEHGLTERVMKRPEHPYSKELIAASVIV